MGVIIKTEAMELTYNKGQSNEYKALRNQSLEIYDGEYIILFGPSGCGKSTLLYSILGTLGPTSGKVYVNGDDIYAYDDMQMVNYQRHTIGIMYQSFNLIPSLSVLDNVALPQIFADVSPEERSKRGMDLLKRFGVAHIAHKLPTNLSGGQMQRVAVARSLVNDPRILLADEPVGNLDSISAEQVMDTLDQINMRDKKTVILVTHDAKYLPYAHRIFYMKDGGLEREVPNPEKQQIKKVNPGTTIVTEIEKLARLYPYSSADDLRVKSIVNYLTQEMDFDQLKRLEDGIQAVIEGKIGDITFMNVLTKPFREGGVGLSGQISEEMSRRIHTILREAHDVRRYRSTVHVDLASYYQQKYTRRLRDYLIAESPVKLSDEQVNNLELAITDRVFGVTKGDTFQLQIEKSIENRGMGINEKDAGKLRRFLEKLLAQGVSFTRNVHHEK